MANQQIRGIPARQRFSPTRLDWIFWITVLACVIWGAIMTGQAMSFDKPKCSGFCMLRAPGVELQLARDASTFQQIIDLGDHNHNIAVITRNTQMDFLFIFLYWSSFGLFALRERHRLSPLVWLAITIAALFDVFENRRILAAMSALAHNQPVTLLPHQFSVVKWIVFAAALLSLALLLRRAAHQIAIPALLGISSLLVLIGTFVGRSEYIGIAVFSLSIALVITLVKYAPFSLTDLLAFIEHAYLLRFQIIAAAILVAALPIGYARVPSVFAGLFDATGWRSLVLIEWGAFQLAWTVMITSRLVLRYGPVRFPLVPPIALKAVGAGTLVRFGLLAVPCVICAWLGSLDLHATAKIFAIAVGLALSIVMLFATAALHFYLEQPGGGTAVTIFPTFGFLRGRAAAGRPGLWTPINKLLNLLPATVTSGLLRAGQLRSGHQMAAIFLFMLIVIYGILGFAFSPDILNPAHLPAALFFLLFVIIILAWFFAGIAFLLDRFRLPVLTTVFALSLLTGIIGTDHEFSLATPKHQRATLSPKDVLDHWAQSRRGQNRKTIAIVATAGGGIRAAAWTAEVLTNLQSECGAQDFSDSVVLISSVSGGSVGSMFFLRRFDADGNLSPDSLKEAVEDAERSSLSAVGWGMLYPDLLRTVPVVGMLARQTRDRGWALENSWTSGWEHAPTLDQWRDAVAQGKLPAAIFNATAVESGQRFLVATTDVADRTTALRFADEFPNWDIPIATAARLSATFTYVSPAARATDGSLRARVHVADGGYYDNSGVVSALEWLREAGEQTLKNYNVLFILIDAGPGGAAPGRQWSWQRQITAPIETLANVRTSSQQFRAKFEVELAQAVPGLHVQKPAAYFLYHSTTENPLSWHLNSKQIDEVHHALDNKDIADNKKLVIDSLGCRARLTH